MSTHAANASAIFAAVRAARQTCEQANETFTPALAEAAIAEKLAALYPDMAEDASPVSVKLSAKARGELFDAFALAVGIDPLKATRPMRRTVAVCLADILSVSHDVTPDEFRRRADLYRRRHPQWPLTPGALAKYWGDLGPANGQTFAAKQELPPSGWEQALREATNEAGWHLRSVETLVAGGWEKLSDHFRSVCRARLNSTET